MFDDRFLLTKAVFRGVKTNTRRDELTKKEQEKLTAYERSGLKPKIIDNHIVVENCLGFIVFQKQTRYKVGEYAKYACNFYKGCSNGCTYCYLKKGVLAHALGGCVPTLKSCFKNEEDALKKFLEDLFENGGMVNSDIMKHDIFFTFTSDPCLPETRNLNFAAIYQALQLNVPVRILTKCTEWIDTTLGKALLTHTNAKGLLSIGFTLTGRDDMEPNASPNAERVKAMRRIHRMGIWTWASIEPVIDLNASAWYIMETLNFCNEYRIGLMSGEKNYTKQEVSDFVNGMEAVIMESNATVYWKESVRKFIGKE